MDIGIFYEHVYEPGGAPVGIRNLARSLAKRHGVAVLGKGGEAATHIPESASCTQYDDLKDLYRQLPAWLDQTQPDVLVVVGFFLYVNVLVVWRASQKGVPIVLHPMAQIWDKSLQGKIFTHGCDVRALEVQRVNRLSLQQRMVSKANPVMKRAYFHSGGRYMVEKSAGVAVLSEEETRQFRNHYPSFGGFFVTLPWGIDPLTFKERGVHFYRDVLGKDASKPNFVVWSRLDWHYKGLDRLFEGVRVLKERRDGQPLPFRLFLCGPDYRGGTVLAEQYIKEHGMEEDVDLLLPGSYEPGSKAPLRDAEASILLSPWDGSPRALRESLYFHTPILVSRETNFGEMVREFESGVLVGDADRPEEVADALMAMMDAERRRLYSEGAAKLADWLDWRKVAGRLAADLGRHLNQPVQEPGTSARLEIDS